MENTHDVPKVHGWDVCVRDVSPHGYQVLVRDLITDQYKRREDAEARVAQVKAFFARRSV